MSQTWNILYVIVSFVSVAFCANCPLPCKCDKTRITCVENTIERFKELTSLPQFNFSDIVEIIIKDQPLRKLPENAFQNAGLSTLTDIAINQCKIGTIHEEAFNNLTDLIRLDLSSNSLTKLGDKTFKPIKNIKFLILNHNQLDIINEFIFVDLHKLQKLELSYNMLTSFHENALLSSNKLQHLHLNNNRLTTLNIDVIKSIKKFNILKINNNPWTCDCVIRDLVDFMKNGLDKNKINYQNELKNTKCSTPTNLNTYFWKDLTTNKLNCWLNATARDLKIYEHTGQNTTLACKVESSTEPTVTWIFQNNIINTISKKYNASITKTGAVEYTYYLIIYEVKEDDTGEYICDLKNTITTQTAEAKIYLSVDEKPADAYYILFIIGLVFCAFCVAIILIKCFIKCSIINKSRTDQPNYHEDSKGEDDVSINSINIEKPENDIP